MRKNMYVMKILTMILVLAALIQTSSLAIASTPLPEFDFSKKDVPVTNVKPVEGIDKAEAIAQLKKELVNSMNKNLVQKIGDYELHGEVNVIITLTDDSIVSEYNKSASDSMTLNEYLQSGTAKKFLLSSGGRQERLITGLENAGLISDVMYRYSTIMDAIYVKTTYEQLEELCEYEGVGRVIISNTYKPAQAEATENPVNVYDTGIFNSSDVSYTGKGTVVAILDTGCDYTHSAFTTHTVESPLYDRDDIALMLPNTIAYSYDNTLEPREVYYGNITGGKVVYGYDYADHDPDVMPFASEHGTHVAGIIGGYDSTIKGVAIDTQLAIMKVFSDYKEGADDGDILAALEDSVILGVDAINLSLGTSCGFTREVDDDYKNGIYDNIEAAGISLIVAASNDYSSAYGSEFGNSNKTKNPDSATVGAPSTYDAAISVASINGNKDKYMVANGDTTVFFLEAFNQSAKEYNFFEMLGIESGKTVEYEYVTIPGLGMAVNYAGLDMTGKIALVQRGDISFEEKVQYAYEAGAAAIIIYNNVFGDIVMTVGNNVKIPVVSIGKDDGDKLASVESGTIVFDADNQAGPFMSDFSSWGPTPSLTLKPEITAHGGNILSAVPGGGYEKLSGTSMAAPNMCGIVILIRQYVKEKYPELSVTEVRDLVNQLCMSTATVALDKNGNPYSPRKQGAGIADIAKATTTEAYLYVEGKDKTKLELGDDPSRSGVYEMTVSLKNLSDHALSYTLGNLTMTESLSSSDKEYVAEMAYMLDNTAEYSVEGGEISDGVVTVQAGKTAKVTAKIILSKEDRAYINEYFENGMYVEGFLTFKNTDESGVDLNVPFLSFFGDWSDAPIFDEDYYMVETEAHNNAIDDDDKIKADYYATTPLGKYYYDYIIPLGCYVYEMDESEYTPIPSTKEHAAISYYKDSISGVYAVFSGLLRGAKEMKIQVVNTVTGEVVWEKTDYNCYKAHYSGVQYPYVSSFDLDAADYDTGEVFGDNNTCYEVTMSAKLDWDSDERNASDTYTFSFCIDYEAPTVTYAEFWTEYDKTLEKNRYYVDLNVYDNHYAMSIRPIIVYDYIDADGNKSKTYSSLSENAIPVYQENRGEASKVTVEITDYLESVRRSAMPEGMIFYVDDYALNSNIVYINFPETLNKNLEFVTPTLDLDINDTFDLTKYLTDGSDSEINCDYLGMLKWESSDTSVVAVKDGKIEALKSGSATVRVTGDSWTYTEKVDGEDVKKNIYKNIVINVSENVSDNPESGNNVSIEDLSFISYDTLFAFNSDIDYSEIGQTGSINYFDGNKCEISCYPSEKIKLHYSLEPWNINPERYELTWSSSNTKVATVDSDGVVTAESEGKARISLQIKIDGKTSLLVARCSVEVKSEFVIENRELVAYKGKGGDVVIPDDKGILYIGSFAFSHFLLDNDMELDVDDSDYNIDLKKIPLGNNTVTSVTIPDGVEEIRKYAFYNSQLLKKVKLPESCKIIGDYAFYQNVLLEDVNFENVKTVSDYAFYGCERLNCDKLGGVNLSGVSVIGKYAFTGCKLISALNLANLRRSGEGAFKDCTKLETVILGESARLAESVFENSGVGSITVYCDTIPDFAFKNCTKLKSVNIKNDLTYLGDEAFSGCKRLTMVEFNGECEYFGDYAFYNCPALTMIVLPDGDVAFGDGVFASTGLSMLTFRPKTQILSAGIGVLNNIGDLTLRVTGSEYYKTNSSNNIIYSKDGTKLVLATPDANLGNFVLDAGIVEICDGAFASNYTLTSFKTAEGSKLKKIGYGTFAYCRALTDVILPDGEIVIDGAAFYEDTALKNVGLSNVTSVGDYAFYNTALAKAELSHSGVNIGKNAFYGCASLKNVTLGEGAHVGEYAFRETPLLAVTCLGGNITVDNAAFFKCTKLTSFDMTNLASRLGDYAFYMCTSLRKAEITGVTEIGEGCFADCLKLEEVKAPLVEIIGADAFSSYAETSEHGAVFTEIEIPSAKKIGHDAFYGCIYLKKIDLSSVEEIGSGAFAFCSSLEKVVLSDKLPEVPDSVFYECTSLSDIDLSHLLRIGSAAFYGVKLPATLNLDSVEYIDEQAFVEIDTPETHYIVTVNAPKLRYLGDQAFGVCEKLTSFNAPMLESIGFGAFMFTSIEEFEVSEKLSEVSYSAFEEMSELKAFYATVNGEKQYSFKSDKVMIDDGVLYTLLGDCEYQLSAYPMARKNTEYSVVDGTVRIEYRAAVGNKFLEKVTLPASLKNIGNYAFYKCPELKVVTFKSYYAPVLEGTMGTNIEITPDSVTEYPGFDKLYKYDYYYVSAGIVATPLYYCNFVDAVTSAGAQGITYIVPENRSGYDSPLYSAYFKSSDENSGKTMGAYAIAFIEAVGKLPATATRFDKTNVENAVSAYNALLGHEEELVYVSEDIIEFCLARYSEYKVSNVENIISRVYEPVDSEYSYNRVRAAYRAFNELTAEEQAEVSNKALLDMRVSELSAEMGKTLDFVLEYSDYSNSDPDVPPIGGDTGSGDESSTVTEETITEETTVEETDDEGVTTEGVTNEKDNDNNTALIVIIVVLSVVAVAIVAAVVFVIVKRRKA